MRYVLWVLFLLCAPISAYAAEIEAQPYPDSVVGDRHDPVGVIVYSSLTCPHCAHFQAHILPDLVKKFVNTHKAYLVHRDFVMDMPSLYGVTLARCSARYDAFIHVLFEKQEYWAFKQDFSELLTNIARLGGVDAKTYQKCLQDPVMKERIVATTLQGKSQYDMQGVPAIIINGELYAGKQSVEDIGKAIEQAYEHAAHKKSALATAPGAKGA